MPATLDKIADVRRDKGEGGVTLRKDGRWQATFTYRDAGDCKQVKTFYGRTKRIALERMKDWKAGDGHLQKSGKSVSQLVAFVLDSMRKRDDLDGDTVKGYDSFDRNYISPRIGNVKIDRLRVHHLDAVPLGMIEDGLSLKTARNCQIFLGQCIKEGHRLGWLSKDLSVSMMQIRLPKYRADIYNLVQVSALIEAASGSRAQPAIVLSALLGIREAECAGLMWADINLKDKTIRIERQNKGDRIKHRTKTESGMRLIPMPDFVWTYLSALPKKSPFLMTSVDGKKPIHPSVIYHLTMEIMTEAKLPVIRFHDLRHSANNILKQLGVPAETRRDILGHSDTSVTENIYTQTVDWEMRDAMTKLQKALTG